MSSDELAERVRVALELLDEAFGADGYDLAGVAHAHRVLCAGEGPPARRLAEVDVDDERADAASVASRPGRPRKVRDEEILAALVGVPGTAPSCRDVAAAVGLSVLQATRRLEDLERRGLASAVLWRNRRRGRPRRLWRVVEVSA